MSGLSRCPGCGVELPIGGRPVVLQGFNASDECQELNGEIAVYAVEHVTEVGDLHELMLNAYRSQHPGEPAPPITTAFGLIGLHLAFDRGLTTTQVRDAHGYLARANKVWPRFEAPGPLGDVTVFDIAMAGSVAEHRRLIQEWVASVWAAWRPRHDEIVELTNRFYAPSRRDRGTTR